MGWDNEIVKNPDFFGDDWACESIPQREEQIKRLFQCAEPLLRRKVPIHAWIHGKPGTGKTLVSRFFLKKLEEKHFIQGAYINCWECRTLYAVLERLVLDLRVLGADKPDARFKLERLKRHLKDRPFVVVLDEIDMSPPKERNNIVYNLMSLGCVGLVCISYSRQTYYELDDRVKSRLNPHFIEFRPYSADDITAILKDRAEAALLPESWNTEDLERIALLSKGDVRTAIQTLKNAVYWAKSEGSSRLIYHHIQNGINKARSLKKKYLLKKLTKDHRILYGLVKKRGEILSGELWNLYQKVCSEKELKPIAPRTYSMYINQLIDLGLIEAERAKIRGKVRIFRAVV